MSEYIERDEFLAEQRHLYCDNCVRRKNSKGKLVYDIGDAPCRACGICDVLDAVEDAPAADVRPVKRGRWIEAFIRDGIIGEVKTLTCSACGYTYGDIFHNPLYNFCPNCGAWMEES